jgi:hypothetical protein
MVFNTYFMKTFRIISKLIIHLYTKFVWQNIKKTNFKPT